MTLGKAAGHQKGPVYPPSAVTLPSQPLSFLQHQALCWLGSGQEMGPRHPHRLEPWALAAPSPHPQESVYKQGEQRGELRVGRNSTGLMVINSCWQSTDSNQRWSEPQPPRASLLEASQHAHTSWGHKLGQASKCRCSLTATQDTTGEVYSGNQTLTWLQCSLSNAMNTVLNIIGIPAKDNRTTHVLSYVSPQVIPGNLRST